MKTTRLYLIASFLLLFIASQAAATIDFAAEPTRMGTTQTLTIEGNDSTAAKTVHVYLPPGYAESNTRYPVLYLMDGQHSFDHPFAAKGGWKIDRTLNQFASQTEMPSLIVVAVEHAPDRTSEYVPVILNHPYFDMEYTRALEFSNFLVSELKPAIDAQFRTKPKREATFIGGASFGSFFSIFAAVTHQETFSKVWAFSTAIFTDEARMWLANFLRENKPTDYIDWFFYVGRDEPTRDSLFVSQAIRRIRDEDVLHFIDEQGGHDEPSWAVAARNALPWLLEESFSTEFDWTGIQRAVPKTEFSFDGITLGETYAEGSITFQFKGEAEAVVLAGTMNGWSTTNSDYNLTQTSRNVWELTLPLKAGEYEYKFVIDNRWAEAADTIYDMLPVPTDVTANGLGGSNAVIVVN